MKNKISILFLFVFLTSHSQVTFKPGIQTGLNISELSGIDISSKTDFFAGVYGEIKFSKNYALQPEISYSRQGAKGAYTFMPPYYSVPVINDNVDISLQYLSFSINNKIFIYKDLYILIGEFNDFIIGNKITQNDYKSLSKGYDIDYGLFGGLGYTFPKGFGVEVRFKNGFADALDDYSGYKSKISNKVFQIGVTYTFGK